MYLKEALELLHTTRDEDVISYVILSMYSLAGLEKIPLDIVECVITIPDYLSPEAKSDIYAQVIGPAYGLLGMESKAIDKYNDAIELNPNDGKAWRNKADFLASLGKHEEAIKCYDKALEINPNDGKAWRNKAETLGLLGKHEEAIKCADKAYTMGYIAYGYEERLDDKGLALQELDKYEEAIECFDKALEIEPDDAEACYNKGLALQELDKYEEAIECFDKALEINPDDGRYWYSRACTEVLKGNTETGLSDLGKAIEINKKYIELAKQDKDFDSIRNNERFKDLIGE
jgi:tetratricopeptide (TPR) repeat protein